MTHPHRDDRWSPIDIMAGGIVFAVVVLGVISAVYVELVWFALGSMRPLANKSQAKTLPDLSMVALEDAPTTYASRAVAAPSAVVPRDRNSAAPSAVDRPYTWLQTVPAAVAMTDEALSPIEPTAAPAASPVPPSDQSAVTPAVSTRRVRPSWTTSRVRGTPEPPPPFECQRVFPEIRFQNPVVMTWSAGTSRLFVGEQQGRIYSFDPTSPTPTAEPFADVASFMKTPRPRAGDCSRVTELEALYGLVFDPEFPAVPHCYLCYVVKQSPDGSENDKGNAPDGSRVSRFRVAFDPDEPGSVPQLVPESEELLLTFLQGGHNGGCLKFGPDGMLYISTGDAANPIPPDQYHTGQDISDLLSSVLRIDVRRADPDNGLAYAIPADNPFRDQPGARGEVWAYGFRNPWKMSFDRVTGELWVADVGWELWELVHRVTRGGNYGWAAMEGPQQVLSDVSTGPSPITPAAIAIPHTDAASVTGGYVYRGNKLPELVGQYIYGDWETRRFWAARWDAQAVQVTGIMELCEPQIRVVAFSEDRDGELYFLDYDAGTIHELARRPVDEQPTPPFPRLLSATGLFVDVVHQTPADGVFAFDVTVPQWSDGAVARRWIALPGNEPVQLFASPQQVPGSMFQTQQVFPAGTVLAKTLYLDPAMTRPVETQLLHFTGQTWRAYAYVWRADGLDADLVPSNGQTISLPATPAEPSTDNQSSADLAPAAAPFGLAATSQTAHRSGYLGSRWQIASRADCLRCHNPWADYSLAWNIPQLTGTSIATDARVESQPTSTEPPSRPADEVGLKRFAERWLNTGIVRLITPEGSLPRDQDSEDDDEASLDGLRAALSAWPRLTAVEPEPKRSQAASLSVPAADTPADADIADLARSYLHVNCAHCHRFGGGGTASLQLVLSAGLDDLKVIGVRPDRGSLGLADAHLVSPGDPLKSTLLLRMAKTGPGRMPHLGSEEVDRIGVRWVERWIASLPHPDHGHPAPDTDTASTSGSTADPVAYLQHWQPTSSPDATNELFAIVRRLQDQRYPEPAGSLLLAIGTRHEQPQVRELFEQFLPADQRAVTLGPNPEPTSILSLAGDAERGRQLYWSGRLNCRTCHRLAGEGVALGPELTGIGERVSPRQILESLLDPSRKIEPKFATWLIETVDGRTASGLLAEESAERLVLKDSRLVEQIVPVAEIETRSLSAVSLMPAGLLKDLTAQQAADLVQYLVSTRNRD